VTHDKRPVYVDTSALAKYYVNERRSGEVEAFIRQERSVTISRLTVVEFRCLLARRRRARDVSIEAERKILTAFENDLGETSLPVIALEDRHALAAIELLSRLREHPLRALDALHLAIAQECEARLIATADRVLANAAQALGFQVARFD
jgi:predicted nucleic acid-binding protein